MNDKDKFDEWAEALWPGDDAVDWLFFNSFGNKPGNKGNFTRIVDAIYSNLEAGARKGNNYTAVPWGIGAFAPYDNIPELDKINFITEAAAAINSSRYPRLRALVYFGSKGDSPTAGMLPAFSRFLGSEFFAANDLSDAGTFPSSVV